MNAMKTIKKGRKKYELETAAFEKAAMEASTEAEAPTAENPATAAAGEPKAAAAGEPEAAAGCEPEAALTEL